MTDERVTLRLARIQLEQLDLLVQLGEFDDRSTAIRQAIRELVDSRRAAALRKANEIEDLKAKAAGALRADELSRK